MVDPVMSFLRFLMLLSLIVWLGGLIFFPVIAQTAFSVLPTRHLAGAMVGRSLGILHWMGMISGLVFLGSSLLLSRLSHGEVHAFAPRNVLICLMLLLTLISQFGIIPRMDAFGLRWERSMPRPLTFPLVCSSMRCTIGLRGLKAECCCSVW